MEIEVQEQKYPLKVEWQKLYGFKFIGRLMGYSIQLDATDKWAVWAIEKDGIVLDHCLKNPPAKGELDARVKTEKRVLRLIDNFFKASKPYPKEHPQLV